MPIYAYECQSCGHELEALQKVSAEPLKDCPHCHTASLTKRVTAAAFRLGGGGWYETDFKNGNKKNLASKEAAPDNKPSPSSTGSDNKADTSSKSANTSATAA